MILSLFLLYPTGKGKRLHYNLELSLTLSSKAPLLWYLNAAYVMFVRISPLLDILHCYFLHGAPWHDLLFSTPPLERKKRNSRLGFYERSNPVEKVCTATLLCHPRRSDPQTSECNKCNFRKSVYVKFPVPHSPAQTPGVVNQSVFGFLVPSPVPLRVPTKLPAYPSSPTPI